jgi:adenylate kinase family enzyme
MSMFKKATKSQSKLRLALLGPTGSGKTYTALRIAKGLGSKVAFIDTERGSASKYSGDFDFDVLELESFAPATYVEAIRGAQAEGYDVLIIDSLSHAWMGKEGALEQVDKVGKRSGGGASGNNFGAWREVTPMHNSLVDTILASRMHVIATMRVKMDYVMEEDSRGKKSVRKIGLQPQQRDGVEYEFDVIADIDQEHNFIVSKTRCSALDGYVQKNAGEEVADKLKAWLTDGAPRIDPVAELEKKYAEAGTREQLVSTQNETRALWPGLNAAEKARITSANEAAKTRITELELLAQEAAEQAREAAAAEEALRREEAEAEATRAAQDAAEQGEGASA